MNEYKIRQETIQRYGDVPTNALEALAHTVAVWEGQPDDRVMVEATSNTYGPGVRTGLTMGDLRELLRRLS